MAKESGLEGVKYSDRLDGEIIHIEKFVVWKINVQFSKPRIYYMEEMSPKIF